ncbi:CCAAT/enhancer-binding protein gamma [Pseudolycoriella hygida]|uniref:CCAAT/enhancer-binding protein gamma n=1 Tax=Pseudolycoriella hygida TaxID=35572 RepID=A0A9Q0MZ25_9DIPT|nr:CCAAT/enhancer-binding protein gamma [Pseudolycoriella hygida]
MPSKRKGTSVTSEEDEDYRSKRDRNNLAVKRSRVKSKERKMQTQTQVKDLKIKNQVLEEKIKNLTKDLKFLKDLFLAQAQTKAEKLTNEQLRQLLADDDDEKNEPEASTSAG